MITNFAEGFRRGPINNNPFLLMSKPSETSVGKLEQNYQLELPSVLPCKTWPRVAEK